MLHLIKYALNPTDLRASHPRPSCLLEASQVEMRLVELVTIDRGSSCRCSCLTAACYILARVVCWPVDHVVCVLHVISTRSISITVVGSAAHD